MLLYAQPAPDTFLMNVLGKNITDLARERQLSIPRLAMRAGVDKGNLSRIIKTGEGYSSTSLGKLADALSVSIDRLFAAGQNVERLPLGVRKVPLIDPMHVGRFCDAARSDSKMQQDYVLTRNEYSARSFAMKVLGDSMLPDFSNGDEIIVDPEAELRPGRFVVATNGSDEGTLKRYADRGRDEDGNPVFELIPSNPHYSTLRSDRNPQLKILGVVRERVIKLA